jgi:hypothetical protein
MCMYMHMYMVYMCTIVVGYTCAVCISATP